MRSLSLLLSALAWILVAQALHAQPTGHLSASLTLPQGEFGSALDGSVGVGATATALFQIPRSPLAVGVEGGASVYGYERRREPFSRTIPDVFVDVSTSSNFAQGLALLRLQRPDGAVRPYLDGLAGVNYLYTETSVSDRDYYREYDIASSVNFDDFAPTAGLGGGLQVHLGTDYDKPGRPTEFLVDGRVRYLWGGEASFLTRSDRYGDFRPQRSHTDVLQIQLGVTTRF